MAIRTGMVMAKVRRGDSRRIWFMTLPGDTEDPAWPSVRAALAGAPAGPTVAVSVRDLQTGATFGYRDDRAFPAASTVKVLILIALARAVDDGRLSLDQRLPVGTTHKAGGSGVLNWLATGLELTLQDHAWLMIAISDNTASNVLIEAIGMPAIHDVQQSLGLVSTSLNRRFFGRQPETHDPVNIACARELTDMLAAIADGSAASTARCTWMLTLLGDQQVTDRLARHLPDGVRFAGKSGWVQGISHDAGLLRGPGGEAAVAVMTEGFTDLYAAAAFIGTVGTAAIDDVGLR